jgi:hypothetical protein
MIKNEFGRSMIEMLAVLALIAILGIGSIAGYLSANASAESNKITELVSIASLTAKTKMKNYDNVAIWKVLGKKKTDYKCINELTANANGRIVISFDQNNKCDKVYNSLKNQWGNRWNDETNTYTPPVDEGAM